MTLTGIVDETWGEDAIADIENIAKKGHEGDTPEQPPFAKNRLFWIMAINAAVMGVLLGLAGVVFINIIDKVPELWSDFSRRDGYDFEEEENVGFNDGKVNQWFLEHSSFYTLYFTGFVVSSVIYMYICSGIGYM